MSEYVKQLTDHVTEHGAIPRLVIDHPAAQAEVFLQGAHLARWKPAGEAGVLYLSPRSHFENGIPIRGGIPICFPIFNDHPTDKAFPKHGFARIRTWDLVSHQSTPEGVNLHFQYGSDEWTHRFWPHDFILDYRLSIGRTLSVRLGVTNTGEKAFPFEEALHTYFSVSDVRQVAVQGLQGTEYVDQTENMTHKIDALPRIDFPGEVDRIYFNTTATCTIHDPGEARRIVIEKTGSRSTVIWNPCAKKAGSMKDLGEANWPAFVCVETANCRENTVQLLPGNTHAMAIQVRVEREGAGS